MTTSVTGSSIISALGSGSGVDTASLVSQLVEAQFAAQTQRLTARSDALTAQISGVAKLKSAVTGFDAALRALAAGGTLTTQPTSSNAAVATAAALPGAKSAGPSARLEVRRLASAQTATSAVALSTTRPFRTGTLTVRFGAEVTDDGGAVTGFQEKGPPLEVRIDDAGLTLDGVASRINAAAAKAGVGLTAAVIADGDGARLSITGPTGANGAFRITAADGAGADGAAAGLSALAVSRDAGSPSAIGVAAGDAVVALGGAEYRRASNSVSDLVAGVKLEFAGVGAVTLGGAAPTAALSQAVGDVVATYNEVLAGLKEQNDAVTGPLRQDPAAGALARGLRSLTTEVLIPDAAPGAPRTLADLGVATARDGTLSVDQARLARALAAHPAEVEAMFAPGAGLPAALSAVVAKLTGVDRGLDASAARYADAKGDLADEQARIADKQDGAKTRMTRQFAAMDARVAAYKATQAFMENQVKAWSKSDD